MSTMNLQVGRVFGHKPSFTILCACSLAPARFEVQPVVISGLLAPLLEGLGFRVWGLAFRVRV